ncbi:MAG TPA: hypothetical protein VK540_20315 [Polyangiaceae bacterium]|nr:hypothetical protein [Polyangiaceae bacterium]
MSPRNLARRWALVAWLPFALTTCGGASFDDQAVIKGLRVLAVQKSAPYPAPGEGVDVKLLFWDGKSTEDNPRDVHIYFARNACENPPGDLYLNCLSALAGGFVEGTPDGGNPDDMPDGGGSDGGESDGGTASGAMSHAAPGRGFVPIASENQARFRNIAPSDFVRATEAEKTAASFDVDHVRGRHFRITDTIVRPRTGGEPYGLAYVLFAACPGHLGLVPNAAANTLPLGCFDDTDNHRLGADDFVIGYTSMYVYTARANTNPIVNDFLFEGASFADSTTDDSRVPHIPNCQASDRSKCPKYPLKVAIDRASAEIDTDPTAKTPDGRDLQEQMWVAFYLTAGELKSSLRLVNDATRGWNEENGTEFTAPAEPGPVRIFAVVHDNRGGIAWVEGKIIVD